MKFSSLSLLACLLLSVQSKAQQCSIAALRENVLYVGLPNFISAVAAGYSCKNIIVEANNGKLEKIGECQYTLYVETAGTATIQIFSRAGHRLLGRSIFRVKQIPIPTAKVGGKNKGALPANILRVQLGLWAVIENMDIDVRILIKQYFLTLIRKDGSCANYGPATTGYFNEEMKAAIASVKSGDRIIFSGIKAIAVTKDELLLDPIEITIE